MSTTETDLLQEVADAEYKYGFVTDTDADTAPKGLSEDVVRMISEKKGEPAWLLDWRLKAYRHFETLLADREAVYPHWAHLQYQVPDFQDISYYSAPQRKATYASLDEVDPKILETFERSGNPPRRAEAPERRRLRRGDGLGERRHDVPRGARQAAASSSARSPRPSASTRS